MLTEPELDLLKMLAREPLNCVAKMTGMTPRQLRQSIADIARNAELAGLNPDPILALAQLDRSTRHRQIPFSSLSRRDLATVSKALGCVEAG